MSGRWHLTASPTERTTALTDALLAIQGIGGAGYIYWIGQSQPWKAGIWTTAFLLLALASFLGVIVHGFEMPRKVYLTLWGGLTLALGLTVALFLAGVLYDWWGYEVARFSLPILLLLGLAFFVLSISRAASFLLFIVYEVVALVVAIGGYGWLMVTGQLAGAGWMFAGVLLTLIAAGIQTRRHLSLTLIWEFDHNGLFHIVQLVANGFLLMGLWVAFS